MNILKARDKQLHFLAGVIIALMIVLFSTPAFAFDLSTPDKQKHILGSALIGSATGIMAIKHDDMTLKSGSIAFGVAMIPGILKEALDSQEDGNKWDNEDLVADAVGVLASMIVVKLGHGYFFTTTSESLQIGMLF